MLEQILLEIEKEMLKEQITIQTLLPQFLEEIHREREGLPHNINKVLK
jgi:DNA polymerase III epsilon subunit-like protein